MLELLTDASRRALLLAGQQARTLRHEDIRPVHVFLALLELETGAHAAALRSFQSSLPECRRAVLASQTKGELVRPLEELDSTGLYELIVKGHRAARKKKKPYVGLEHLMHAALDCLDEPIRAVVTDAGIDTEKLKKGLAFDPTPILSNVGTDMTKLAFRDRREVALHRDEELDDLVETLTRRSGTLAMLIGPSGVGKSAMVAGLARRMARGEVPRDLQNATLFALDLSRMIIGTKHRGELEERLAGVLREAASEPVVLFFDEFQVLFEKGTPGAIPQVLLAMGSASMTPGVRMVAAMTDSHYAQLSGEYEQLRRRSRTIRLSPLTPEQTRDCLRLATERYPAEPTVVVPEELLAEIPALADRFLAAGVLPGKAIRLLEDVISRPVLRRRGARFPELVEAIERLESKKDSAVSSQDFERAAKLRDDAYVLKKLKEQLQNSWRQVYEDPQPTRDDLGKVMTRLTGLPRSWVGDMGSQPLELRAAACGLSSMLPDQEGALKRILRTCTRRHYLASLRDRPLGVFLLAGPSGSGKSYLARGLSRVLYGEEGQLVSVDMAGFDSRGAIEEFHERLRRAFVDIPTCAVGTQDECHPQGVLFLDHVDRAHPVVKRRLVSWARAGWQIEGPFGPAPSANITVIFSTDGGVEEPHLASVPARGPEETAAVRESIASRVERFVERELAPQLLNLLDETLILPPPRREDLLALAEVELRSLKERLAGRSVELDIDPELSESLLREADVPELGVRPVHWVFRRRLVDPLIDFLLSAGDGDGQTAVRVAVKASGDPLNPVAFSLAGS